MTNGVGTSRVATSVLRVSLGTDGSLLNLRLLGDDSASTIDPAVANPSAFTRLAPLDVTSTVVPALNLSLPGLEAKSPGGTPSITSPAVSLASPVTSGTLNPATLGAVVDQAGARSGLNSSLTGLNVVGGLLAVPSATSSLSTDSAVADSDGVRGLDIDQITVLDLGALLDGLGLSLADLPLATVEQLLAQLNLPLPALGGADLTATVDQLNTAIDDVQQLLADTATTVDAAAKPVVDAVGGIISGLPGGLGGSVGTVIPPVSVGSTVAQLNDTLDGLQETLTGLLEDVLATLDGVALLSVNDIQAGIITKAAGSLPESAAQITAKVGSVSIGGVGIPGVDLAAAGTSVTALVNSVTAQVGGVLGTINPALSNLVSVKVLEQTKSVTQAGRYVQSLASLTALTATITPPANLTDIVNSVKALPGVGDLLGTLGLAGFQQVSLDTAMSTLEGALGGVQALAGGGTVRVAELTAASNFVPGQAAPAPAPGQTAPSELPRTGGDFAPMAVLGILCAAVALGIIRWLRTPLPVE